MLCRCRELLSLDVPWTWATTLLILYHRRRRPPPRHLSALSTFAIHLSHHEGRRSPHGPTLVLAPHLHYIYRYVNVLHLQTPTHIIHLHNTPSRNTSNTPPNRSSRTTSPTLRLDSPPEPNNEQQGSSPGKLAGIGLEREGMSNGPAGQPTGSTPPSAGRAVLY